MSVLVLANGCFDMLHYGHLLHLQAARKFGDILVVSVTADEYVNKPRRPIYPQAHRAAVLRALRCVDDVIVVSGLLEALHDAKPDILVKGIDYAGGLEPSHADYCKRHGIKVEFTITPKYSTTGYLNELKHR